MKLCIATCWDDDYLHELVALSRPGATIHEVFGSFARSPTGSGRDAAFVPAVDAERVRRHVAQAHACGLRFNYLMNGSCMGGDEFTTGGRAELRRQIGWLDEIGVDAVTVAIPFLVELIRAVAPRLEVVVSTIAHVDSVSMAQVWRDLGAHRITVATAANRDLALLRSLGEVGCALEVLANEMCLFRCALRAYHYGLMSHGSRLGAAAPPVEYPHLHCSRRRIAGKGELLKARFIRPEDVATYEECKVELVKVAGRGRDAAHLLRAARAYVERRYEGNLLDITDLGLWSADGVDVPRIRIDNRALDGFLARVTPIDCARRCGTSCTICDEVAGRLVEIEAPEAYLAALDRAREEMTSGAGEAPTTTDVYGGRRP